MHGVSSFAKSLFLGEIHDELAFPFPRSTPEEEAVVRALVETLRKYASHSIDPHRIEEQGWGSATM